VNLENQLADCISKESDLDERLKSLGDWENQINSLKQQIQDLHDQISVKETEKQSLLEKLNILEQGIFNSY
jgi:predicted  nucleic acid-binding Zn-ribbon protein